jgi:hypothetical protein
MPHDRRDLLAALGGGLALLGSEAVGQVPRPPFPLDFRGRGKIPWFRRVFHLFTGADGLTQIEQLPVNAPLAGEAAQFLRRNADRVTVAGMAAGAGFTFHVANQPTLLIPIFGSLIVGLADGSNHIFGHGDMTYAEDCTGKGHISRAGPQGAFTVQVQLPKALCPASGSSDRSRLWTE